MKKEKDMLIKEIIIAHFGKLHNKKVKYEPGFNIVYGNNEAGKSTIHSFIFGMIFGIEKTRGRESKEDLYTKYLPWDTPTLYGGTMVVEIDGKEYQVNRSFYKENKHLKVVDYTTGMETEYESYKVPPQFGNITKQLYRNTISMEQNKSQTSRDLEEQMRNYFANLTLAKHSEIDINQSLKYLSDKKRKWMNSEIAGRWQTLKNQLEELPILERKREDLEEQIKKEEESLLKIRSKGVSEKKKKLSFFTGVVSVLITVVFGLIFTVLDMEYSIRLILYFAILFTTGIWMVLNRKNIKETPDENLSAKRLNIDRLCWELEKLDDEINGFEVMLEEQKILKLKLEEQHINIAAINLAIETIQKISEEIQLSFGNDLNEKVSALASEITDYNYKRVYVNDKLDIKVLNENKELKSINALSHGTKDQLFLALRLATGSIMIDYNMPIILDDSFALYDERRCLATLNMLAKEKRQIIIFTCHKREIKLLDQLNIKYNLIEL